jgi:hypothetical protein
MGKLLLKCEEAQHICDKSQYSDISFFEILRLKLHFLYCKGCCVYTANNTKLTELINKLKANALNPTEKEKLQHTFEAELAKQQQ